MKICPYCKNENPDTNKFCNYCGAQLSGVEPEGGAVEEPDFSEFFEPQQASAANAAVRNRNAQYEDFTNRQEGQNANQPGMKRTYISGTHNAYQAGAQNAYQAGAQNAYQAGAQNAYQQGAQNAYQAGAQNAYQAGAQNAYQAGAQNAYQQGAQNVPAQGVQTGRNHPVQYTYSPTPFDSKIPEIAIGKYIVWSIFDILFSLLFGILGLIFVLKINKSGTVEEQQKNLKYARIFLIIGTIIAALNIILAIGSNFF